MSFKPQDAIAIVKTVDGPQTNSKGAYQVQPQPVKSYTAAIDEVSMIKVAPVKTLSPNVQTVTASLVPLTIQPIVIPNVISPNPAAVQTATAAGGGGLTQTGGYGQDVYSGSGLQQEDKSKMMMVYAAVVILLLMFWKK